MRRHQLGEARLVDRHLAVVEGRHLGGVDVAQRHLAAHRRQADAGDQADVARADHADARRGARPVLRHGVLPAVSTVIGVSVWPFASFARLSGRSDFAISWIVFALSPFWSVLEIQ